MLTLPTIAILLYYYIKLKRKVQEAAVNIFYILNIYKVYFTYIKYIFKYILYIKYI